MLPTWLKPTYIVIAVLTLTLGVQTLRLANSQTDVAEGVVKMKTLVAEIATKRAEGVAEGARQQREAQLVLDRQHASIVTGLMQDKIELQKHYDATYGMLRDLAAQPKWSCLKEPLPEPVLQEFRR